MSTAWKAVGTGIPRLRFNSVPFLQIREFESHTLRPSYGANMNFEIDESFLTDVPVVTQYPICKDATNPTDEELIKIIKGEFTTSHSSADHPEFTKLRESLGEQGYIKIERNWWNGDSVLKPFSLNGHKFKKNDQFSCASATFNNIEGARQRKKNKASVAKR